MALPATDNFNRADGGLGANWTTLTSLGNPAIASNVVTGTSGVLSAAYWNADTPNAAQYAFITIVYDDGSDYGPTCRGSATDFVCLYGAVLNQEVGLRWYNGEAWTAIGSNYNVADWLDGTELRVEADGSSFVGKLNGTQRCSGSNASAPSTGRGGLFGYSNGFTLDNFEVGNLGGAAPEECVGVANGAGTATVALTKSKRLAGATDGVGAATAALTITGAVQQCAGGANGVGTEAAALLVSRRLAGVSAGVGSAAAAMLVSRRLAGVAAGTGSETAALLATRTLAGASLGVGVETATVTVVSGINLAAEQVGSLIQLTWT